MTCAGVGVIGGGWVAYFLARGYRVVAWDPAPDAETRLRHLVDSAWPALTELGLSDGAHLVGRDALGHARARRERISRASSGVATSAPIASMIVLARSTSCAFVARTPLLR